MKVSFYKIGRVTEPAIQTLVTNYQKRLQAYSPIQTIVHKDTIEFKNSTFYVGLDESGREFSSLELSEHLKSWRDDPTIKHLCFVIGGPYGLNAKQKSSCQTLWSLSKGTFTSDLAWLITWEQVYRAFSILHGSSYHHGKSL